MPLVPPRAGRIKIEPGEKRFMALRDYVHGGIRKDLAHGFHDAVSEPDVSGEKRQQFGQNLFRRINTASGEKIVKPQGILSVLVRRIYKCNPVECVGKKPRSLGSLRNTVDVMIVLARSVGRELGAYLSGHVGPHLADSGGKWLLGLRRSKGLLEKLSGTLLSRQARGAGLHSCVLTGSWYDEIWGESVTLTYDPGSFAIRVYQCRPRCRAVAQNDNTAAGYRDARGGKVAGCYLFTTKTAVLSAVLSS